MAPIKYSRIVSYSSEDPVHKVDNLLNPESTKKWKCKAMGEKQATVILQLSSQVQISSVDIGNEYSAFVEVFAAKSSNPDEFKVLLPAVCMMSIQDSKQGVGVNSVRFFKSENLLHADETWDRIKVVCTQPYNKCVQYGLAFITVHSAIAEKKKEVPTPETPRSSNEASSSQKLGNFVLKDDSAESSPISLGNWFSKRKAISPPKEYVKVPRISLSSSIKEDSSPHIVKAAKPKKVKGKTDDFSGKIEVKVPEYDGSARRATRGPLLYVPDEDEDDATNNEKDVKPTSKTKDSKEKHKDSKPSESVKKRDINGKKDVKNVDTKDSKQPEKKDKEDKKDSFSQKNKDFKELKNKNDGINPNEEKSTSSTASRSNKQKKPFDRLLEGVTFVISGFENPLRGDLRNQALEMGAFYKANWDKTCTHLVCAFPNTPKCRSVQSLNGKIVTKDWIADCYNQCKRLPWRRYALLRSDQAYSESEEEIEEEKPVPTTSRVLLSSSSHHDSQSQTSSSSKNTSPSANNKQFQAASISPSQNTSISQSQIISNNPSEATSNSISQATSPSHSQSPSHDLSDDDTDIDDSAEFIGKMPSCAFKNIFQDLTFLVHSSIEESLRDKLFRYITTYGGYCSCEGFHKYTPISKPSSYKHWDYILTENLNQDEKTKYSNTKWIRSDWIWECINQNELVSYKDFRIKF